MSNAIVSFSREYATDVARLHVKGITTGFLSTTSNSFLRILYRAISRSSYSRVFIALDEATNRTLGFIACSLDTGKMYRQIIIRYGLLFFILLIPRMLSLTTLEKIIETLFYTKRKNNKNKDSEVKSSNGAELLSIAVDENARGQKIGKKLISALEKYLTDNNIHAYKVVTYSKDDNANVFYRACGFIKQSEFIHHGNLMFEYSKAII
jgi:ribosomal protein S18 acetylase RimI-like enzyme